jgi:hypothetical protein
VEGGLFEGLAFAVYTRDAKLGLFSIQRYREFVQLAERRWIASLLQDCLTKSRDIGDLIGELDR